ncbi:divergent protein kinase domain 2B isoform X2 [Pygocentrus nattereri]|uniref:FAM69 protein-kinase domain-containing protein n=1 Tax=Pygocentrus nattereri TaxID=42514 RepID=A0A3B4EDX4_PYGNA|nr:divergent protein kinase domain 2B isoform X2 [Pygocentrus nattereri]
MALRGQEQRQAAEGLSGPWLNVWFLCFALPLVASNPSLEPEAKSDSFGRHFLGLDKCNACVGTSICKKFLKEQIRFERWLSSQHNLPSANSTFYEGNYTDDSESWRPVVLSRLVSPHLHDLADKSICKSAGKRKSCSIEAVLRATQRFQNWTQSNLLLPSMVQGLTPPMLRCPSQRLLDRIVRRYFEVVDVGSVQMKHFTTKDRLRLLYTLAVNQQPLILQMFPGMEGWPFPRYHGSCGRLMVWAGSRPLKKLYSSPLAQRADAAYQLLHITQSLASNSLRFNLYYTTASEDMFGTVEDGRLLIMDASTIGIIDLQEVCVFSCKVVLSQPKQSEQRWSSAPSSPAGSILRTWQGCIDKQLGASSLCGICYRNQWCGTGSLFLNIRKGYVAFQRVILRTVNVNVKTWRMAEVRPVKTRAREQTEHIT